MHEEIRYPVCPHRNVAAAYQRFLGPDSGGIERFFPNARANRADGTLLIVRARGRRVVSGAVDELWRAARGMERAARAASSAIEVCSAGLASAWTATAAALSSGRDAALLVGRAATLLLVFRFVRLPV